MVRIAETSSSEEYRWGEASFGWHLLNHPELSVIQELVPAGERERRHYHSTARQFFYVLAGEAVLEVGGTEIRLAAGQGVEVPPGTAHQFGNESQEPVSFLLVSSPHAHGDRTEVAGLGV
ncbi:MAG: cupin domain-containing protein [Thermoanaerobaculia bacterium]|nr:cupin domain-containing protein [Thermoanaerobaculia bacterium]